MTRFITASQYKKLTQIPRGRLAVRTQVFCGAVIEDEGRVVMVKDKDDKVQGWDFPGGKLLWNEDVLSCTQREVLEEARYKVSLKKLLGIYQRKTGPDDQDYFRFLFIAKLKSKHQMKKGDPLIEDVRWFKIEDVLKSKIKVRSQEVIRELQDYVDGKSFPLNAVELYVW